MGQYTTEELALIAENMRAYGGSFVGCIGEALAHADHVNTYKLVAAFPEYFHQYLTR